MTWYPIARSDDLQLRSVYRTELLGRELVAWRADDGNVNVWENRCLHRGVRLSIGSNDGAELTCRYHGWRYANRTGGCTYIPAHPVDAPARTICNDPFPVVERGGLVWTSDDGDDASVIPDLDDGFPLRNLPVDAPADLVRERLAARADLASAAGATVTNLVQPVDATRSVIRPVRDGAPTPAERLEVLRRHNTLLVAFRDELEAEAAVTPPPDATPEALEEVLLVEPPVRGPATPGRSAPLRVTVARKWTTADGIAAFELVPADGRLPTFQPGAHIDVHLPNGLVRQYSVTNGPGEQGWYRIGVKREPESRGGSEALHDRVQEGDVLAISEPRNNFPLRRDALRTVLVAGGIGITPLLAMAQVLDHEDLTFELHYFARDDAQVAFREVLDRLGGVHLHVGLDPHATGARLAELLDRPPDTNPDTEHLYVCGPGPMLDATRRIADERGWPDDTVHFEYFANPTEIDDSTSFTVELARSAHTLTVGAGQTILEVLRDAGVPLPSSCEMGACGTCEVAVLDGAPVHHDVYLTDREKAAGNRLMVCVSRAAGERLVLDL